jgi:cell division protein FtsB
MRRAQKEAASIQREIDQIDQENRKLQENVKALKSDPAAIERIAREEMGLARPGEYIFKLPAKPGDAPALVSPPDSATKP